ncbi:hypothetical protein [Streptomyces sp. BBFR109]|uniref:hypothetical protein n=1 Tax=Streptomyces sp. BBFR109 TaxID=3448172 RepID=UPI003F75B3B3
MKGALEDERVLGQIERGEVLAGPEAARRIAARHQEAYGNAVWGSGPSNQEQEQAVGPRARNRRNVNHHEVAAELRSRPGEWLLVGEWPSRAGAESATLRIRTAYQARMYEPAGAFEARTELTEMGAKVEARYVGHRTSADDAAWADALSAVGGVQ